MELEGQVHPNLGVDFFEIGLCTSIGISTPLTIIFRLLRWSGRALPSTSTARFSSSTKGGGGVHFVHLLRGDAGGVSALALWYSDGAGDTKSSSEGPKWCLSMPGWERVRGGGRRKRWGSGEGEREARDWGLLSMEAFVRVGVGGSREEASDW